jgi:hypothetical protein
MDRYCETCARNLTRSGPKPVSVRNACNDCGYAWRSCRTCGEPQRHDEPEHEFVERIVRPFNNYGGVPALGTVRVEPRHLEDPHVLAATMDLDEAAALEKHRRAAAPRVAEIPRLQQAVIRAQEAEKQRLEKINDDGRRWAAKRS